MSLNRRESNRAAKKGAGSVRKASRQDAVARMQAQQEELYSDPANRDDLSSLFEIGPHKKVIRTWLWWMLAALCAGSAATLWWIRTEEFAWHRIVSWRYAVALAAVAFLTSGNLLLRWLRWHALLRRFSLRLPTRGSLAFYLATLPVLVVPLLLGELLRVWLLSKHYPTHRNALLRIWFVERFFDVSVLGYFWISAVASVFENTLLALLLLSMVAYASYKRKGNYLAESLVPLVMLSAVAWLFPAVGFKIITWLVAADISVADSILLFSKSTLVGGGSGLPLGAGLTGSVALHDLMEVGLSRTTSILVVLAFRAGTVWYAVALGLVVLALVRGRVVGWLNASGPGQHFNELAPQYQNALPGHVQTHVVKKKVALIAEAHRVDGMKYLDVGCGQGWYATALALQGAKVSAVDNSPKQLEFCRHHASASKVRLDLHCTDAGSLPFSDESFDVCYAVNSIHHIGEEKQQQAALAEIVRVLKPGGVFLLHEMNIRNPIFHFYMSYVFPILRPIDEGTERWLVPTELPLVAGAHWMPEIRYFTFLPDFLPEWLTLRLRWLEQKLERSRCRSYSAHYFAVLKKESHESPDRVSAPPDKQQMRP